jgi:outer membrane protein assembly factor BamB
MMRRSALLVAAAVLAACSSDGKVREPAELTDIVNPALKTQSVWNTTAGEGSGDYSGMLQLAVAEDAVFAADVEGRVFAFDPASGKRIWQTETDARVISGPTVAGNAVLVGSMEGQIIALKRADGTAYWTSNVSSEALAPPVSDGTLVVARSGDGRIHAMSAVSGKNVWMFDRGVPNLTLRGLGEPVIAGSLAFVGMDNGRVAALRMLDGQPLWEQLIAAPTGRNELERLTDVDAALVLEDGDVFAASYGGEVARVDGDTGQVLWRREVKSYAGMALAGNLVVVADEAGVVWALDVDTGAAAWKNEDLKYRKLSPPAVLEGHVVVGDFEGYLHWLDARDGRLIARSSAGGDPIRTAPVASPGGLLYVLNTSGRVTALKIN